MNSFAGRHRDDFPVGLDAMQDEWEMTQEKSISFYSYQYYSEVPQGRFGRFFHKSWEVTRMSYKFHPAFYFYIFDNARAS